MISVNFIANQSSLATTYSLRYNTTFLPVSVHARTSKGILLPEKICRNISFSSIKLSLAVFNHSPQKL